MSEPSVNGSRRGTVAYKPVPVFLRKTFDIVETCDEDIAGWSNDGLHVIVKDPERLASDVFPHYFNHKNFVSFVRQLHFYGFRKLKAERSSQNTKSCRFMHPKFYRGGEDQLRFIRRSGGQVSETEDVPNRFVEEIDSMKSQVEVLRSEVADISKEVNAIKELFRKPNCSKLLYSSQREPFIPVMRSDHFCSVTPTHDMFKSNSKEAQSSPAFSLAEVSQYSNKSTQPEEQNKKHPELWVVEQGKDDREGALGDPSDNLLKEAVQCFLQEEGGGTLFSQKRRNVSLVQEDRATSSQRKRWHRTSSIIHVPPVPFANARKSSFVPAEGALETRYFKPLLQRIDLSHEQSWY